MLRRGKSFWIRSHRQTTFIQVTRLLVPSLCAHGLADCTKAHKPYSSLESCYHIAVKNRLQNVLVVYCSDLERGYGYGQAHSLDECNASEMDNCEYCDEAGWSM